MPAARSRTSARTAVVWEVLRETLDRLAPDGTRLRVLDAGGGTGGFAVPLAELGHDVTVVDPSPDSLAALERRAAETGTSGAVHGVQGDAAGVTDVVAPGSIDLVLCHSVLEVVDDPAIAVGAIAGVLRSGGVASILVASRIGAVLARVAAGRLGEARRLLDHDTGAAGEGDPLLRRFTAEELHSLVVGAGLAPQLVHGVRVFADVVPAALVDADPDAARDLLALELAASQRSDYLGVANQLHLLADRS